MGMDAHKRGFAVANVAVLKHDCLGRAPAALDTEQRKLAEARGKSCSCYDAHPHGLFPKLLHKLGSIAAARVRPLYIPDRFG